MTNFTIITEFLFMEFANIRELQVLHAIFFLLIYLATIMGNFLTITAVVTDSHLHAPMYFFLSNLSLLDICYISVTLPKFIVNTLMGIQSISLLGCNTQIFFFLFFGSTEFAFLMTMSYDRFVAICHPLHYGVIMTPARCLGAAVGSWLMGIVYSALHTGNMFRLPFSGSNVIHQFFCDIPQILKVAASNVYNTEYLLLAISSCFLLLCFIFLIISYARIFSNVLKIPSVEGRYKALSTCSPHLIVLLLFLLSAIIAVLGPTSEESSIQSLLIAMAYTVLPPFMNPIIYSLRNKKIKVVLIRIIKMALFLRKDVSNPKKIKKIRKGGWEVE
ncbi:olfactory receptor 14I1-like [Monodelphis domestica]|uniref:olfactory receptor 14I1-like n=1 Tax=Monodelphis domestica TaxID=13616 RepID=UPI0024E19CE4|nr:olfactory receptor 14I1-like [Monodelphis domestica]